MIFLSAVYFLLFIFLLSQLRRRIIFELSAISSLSFGRSQPGLWLYAVIMFPGTLLHELSHWLMAEILLVPTGKITLIPSATSGQERALGSVATAKSGHLRTALIGTAPFVTGVLTLLFLGYWLDLVWGVAPLWQSGLICYFMVTVGSSLFLSKSDLRSWPLLVFFFVIAGLVVYYTRVSLNFLERPLTSLNHVLRMTVGITFVMILALYLLRRVLEQVTHQKVGQ